ncbi:MAG: hypothetical protein WDM92_03585 [Caulobacteraceae bacterium]
MGVDPPFGAVRPELCAVMTDFADFRAIAFGWRPLSGLSSPREVVRQFTPNWFAATMGTGILALALAQFPSTPALRAAGEGLWIFNIGLFSLFTVLYAARWIFYFDGARRIFGHSVGVDVLRLHPHGPGDDP